ncbi:MAG TPA: Stp1/IreP family PP2C-type Ser/Thr phosphatase [Solirubrobacteraceae bacterium]|nr:Stp1/IreP family PP2C-type Ser/Thr phosphatase [Solirubrobacteraceae bacterium]
MLRAAETIQRTDTGRQRRGNEDSSLAHPPVFVVADGMGGAQAGEVASQIAVEAFAQGLPDDGTPEERLAVRVQEANKRIYEVSRSEHERAGMGTTLTAALLDDAHVAIAHVGDSRAYLFRDGTLQRLTKDHSLVGELVRQGKLTEEQAEEHPQRSIITRALGPEPTVDVDTWTYAVRADDVLLLCSDGLTSMVSEERIAEILGTGDPLDHKADRLIVDANEAGGRDNITVVLFRLEDVGGDAPVDAPTMVAEPGSTAARDADTAVPPVAPAPDLSAEDSTERSRSAVRVPLARTQGRPAAAAANGRPRERRYIKPLAALLATLIVLVLIGAAGYLATRELYFIGTDNQGIVTIYRGLPYDLPGGLHLYETFYVSGVPASALPADRRSTLLNHRLRSQSDAEKLMRSVELGQLTQ